MEMEPEQIPLRSEAPSAIPHQRWPVAVVGLLGCISLISFAYAIRERGRAAQLAAEKGKMAATLSQTQRQVEALDARLNAMSIQAPALLSPAVEPTPQETRRPAIPGVGHTNRASRRVDDGHWKKLEDRLAQQQKAIATTQQNLDKARTDLEGKLTSARDELNGSIARTHDELVTLEKKGERNYYEFDLRKSKQFQRVGPLNLSLRKTNSKHEYYDMSMLVDDRLLSKKHVNLYEPVLVYPADSHQPLEIVVNQITKDGAHGYVSAPKYPEIRSATSGVTTGSQSPLASSGDASGQTASEGADTTQGSLSHRPSARL